MGWFFRVLSWAGILYEVIRCIACAVELVVRKGQTPKGWVKRPDGYVCPRCSL